MPFDTNPFDQQPSKPDSNRTIVGNNTYRVKPEWQQATLNAGYTNFGGGTYAVQFTKVFGGLVTIRGCVVIAAGRATNNIFTLPAGFRPLAREGYYCAPGTEIDVDLTGIVNTPGLVLANAYAYQYLAITFYAEA